MSEEKRSKLIFASSMAVFGTIGIIRRLIPVSSGLLSTTRGFLGAIVVALIAFYRNGRLFGTVSKKTVFVLALTGGLIGFNWILLFEAFNYTTVATATLCYYMQPAIVMALAPVVFGEKMTARRLSCLAASMLGMLLVSGVIGAQGGNAANGKGIAFGLGAAALYAAIVILNKKYPQGDAYDRTIIQLFSAAVIVLPYVLLTENLAAVELGTRDLLLILLMGIVYTGIVYCMYFESVRSLSAQSAAILSYIDPAVSILSSALVLGETMSFLNWIGAFLILASALVSETRLFTTKKGKE